MATNQWTKIGEGMRRNNSSRTIYANFRFRGKTFRHSLETEDKTTARNKLAEFRRKVEKGPIRNEENTIVSEVAPRFLASLAGRSQSTRTRAKGHMKFFVEEFGEKNPRDIKPMELKEWLQEVREENGFAEDCWNKYAGTLESFYAFLIENSFASDNPAKSLEFLKGKAIKKFTPSTEQIKALLDHIEHKVFFPERQETLDFIEFMILTGQGRAETRNAQWLDVDWKGKKINFYRQKTRAIAHQVPLFPALRDFLKRRMEATKPAPSAPIFKVKDVQTALTNACKKLKLPTIGHHAFRRYFITQRLMEGVPPNIVAKWVGHRTSEMVMEIYSSIPNTYEVSFAEKIPAIRGEDAKTG